MPSIPKRSKTKSAMTLREVAPKRWANIAFRILHLVGVCGLGGGLLLNTDWPSWSSFQFLAFGAGAALVVLEAWGHPAYLTEIRGILIGIKLALLGLMAFMPQHAATLFVLIIVIAAFGAHAPGAVRHYSVLYRRRMDL